MKERPIIFSAPMVRSILAGTKSQTRRAVKPQPASDQQPRTVIGSSGFVYVMDNAPLLPYPEVRRVRWDCPHGQPGDRLWGRETWLPRAAGTAALYRADYDDVSAAGVAAMYSDRGWRPSIHMPRWASRITLEITRVRVERLHDITEADAIAEGVERTVTGDGWRRYCIDPDWEEVGVPPMATARQSYSTLWNQIHHPSTWTANPWVWVIEFKKVSEE